MSLSVSIALVVVGLGLVVYFAEKLVEGVVGTSSLFMLTRRVSQWAGAVLVALYVLFFVGGHFIW